MGFKASVVSDWLKHCRTDRIKLIQPLYGKTLWAQVSHHAAMRLQSSLPYLDWAGLQGKNAQTIICSVPGQIYENIHGITPDLGCQFCVRFFCTVGPVPANALNCFSQPFCFVVDVDSAIVHFQLDPENKVRFKPYL